MFLRSAQEFLNHVVIQVLPTDEARMVKEFLDLKSRKEKAVANSDFDTAGQLLRKQKAIQNELASLPVREITRAEIKDALVRDGVDVDDVASGEMMRDDNN